MEATGAVTMLIQFWGQVEAWGLNTSIHDRMKRACMYSLTLRNATDHTLKVQYAVSWHQTDLTVLYLDRSTEK